MNRRRYLGLVAGSVAGLAGCTVSGFPGSERPPGRPSPDGCPDVLDVDRTVCPGETGGPLSVDRASESVSAADWAVYVTVVNRAAEPYGCNPYAWSVFRHDGDAWTRVSPDAHIEPWVELAPGEDYTWQLSASDPGGDADQLVFLDLEPGRYAFAVPFRGPDPVAAVATFAVEA